MTVIKLSISGTNVHEHNDVIVSIKVKQSRSRYSIALGETNILSHLCLINNVKN